MWRIAKTREFWRAKPVREEPESENASGGENSPGEAIAVSRAKVSSRQRQAGRRFPGFEARNRHGLRIAVTSQLWQFRLARDCSSLTVLWNYSRNPERGFQCSQAGIEAQRFVGVRRKSVIPVEGGGCLVLGLDHEKGRSDLGAHCPHGRIGDQG